MNELQIFNSEEFGEVKIVKEDNGKMNCYMNGILIDRFKLLACAMNEEDEEEAWKIIQTASRVFHPMDDRIFNSMYLSCVTYITEKFSKNEYYYHGMFNRVYSKIRKGKVVRKKSDGINIPDSWVERDGFIIPVEIKIGEFDEKALKQLNRYIQTYGSKCGIAVGRTISVDLPSNVEFISLYEMEDVYERTD